MNEDRSEMNDENATLDEELVDREREAELAAMAVDRIADLDWERHAEAEQVERDVERQMADLERDSS